MQPNPISAAEVASFWTPTNQRLLEKLIADKYHAGDIARMMGTTKNAVIGRVRRNKLKLFHKRHGTVFDITNDEIRALAPTHSYQEIADKLGATYDSIRHRCLRHGIPCRPGYRTRGEEQADQRARKKKFGFDQFTKYEQAPEESAKFDNAIPADQRKTLLTLKDKDCRWPVGNPDDEEFFFCGAPQLTGESYCADHCRRAYRFE